MKLLSLLWLSPTLAIWKALFQMRLARHLELIKGTGKAGSIFHMVTINESFLDSLLQKSLLNFEIEFDNATAFYELTDINKLVDF